MCDDTKLYNAVQLHKVDNIILKVSTHKMIVCVFWRPCGHYQHPRVYLDFWYGCGCKYFSGALCISRQFLRRRRSDAFLTWPRGLKGEKTAPLKKKKNENIPC